jgi:hypothetical protein
MNQNSNNSGFKGVNGNGGNGGVASGIGSQANGGNGGSFNRDHSIAGLRCGNGGNGGKVLPISRSISQPRQTLIPNYVW